MVDLDRRTTVSADELRRTVSQLEHVFRTGGLNPGDRAIMAIGNGPMFLVVLAAILRRGASPLLLHGDTPPAEIARTARRFTAPFAVADALGAHVLENLGYEEQAFSCAAWATGVLARNDAEAERLADAGPPLVGVPLHPTSGTTGEPKLAVRPGLAAVAEARHYIDTLGIERDDTLLCAIPMSHAYGYGLGLLVPLVSGATLVSMRRSDAASITRALFEHEVTIYPTVPATLDLLLLGGGTALDVPRLITTAGAPLPARVAAEARRRAGVIVRPVYGTTETGIISAARPDHDPASVGSVGPPMKGVSVRLDPVDDVDEEQGLGHLRVKSPSMMAGYLSPDGIESSPIVDGWFDTGDLACFDEAGNVVLRGREADVINAFGHKVLPSEVEEVVALLPQVVEVKVYTTSNRWGSNLVKAAVVATGGMTAADVRMHCERHLVPYKRPVQITMLDRLPRSASGKIVLSKLP
jgi:acyl-coenzyme A synthetase/AMP-(fatty) acid ligase